MGNEVLTLLLIWRSWTCKISDPSIHLEWSPLHLLIQAFFNAKRHSDTWRLISLLSSTHSGAHPFFERILYKVSSAGSAWEFVLRLRGFPLPGKFSNWPSSIECHILCSTTLIMSVSDLSKWQPDIIFQNHDNQIGKRRRRKKREISGRIIAIMCHQPAILWWTELRFSSTMR